MFIDFVHTMPQSEIKISLKYFIIFGKTKFQNDSFCIHEWLCYAQMLGQPKVLSAKISELWTDKNV